MSSKGSYSSGVLSPRVQTLAARTQALAPFHGKAASNKLHAWQNRGVLKMTCRTSLVGLETHSEHKTKPLCWLKAKQQNVLRKGFCGFMEICRGVSRKGRNSSGRMVRPVGALEGSQISEISPADVELLYPIGQLSLQKVLTLGRPTTLESSQSQNAMLEKQFEPEPPTSVKVYAAQFVNGEWAGERVVLKEYPPPAANMALNELRVYGRLQETRTWFGASQTKGSPILSLLGFFVTEVMPEDSWDRNDAQEGFAGVASQPVAPLDQQIVESALRGTGLGGREELSTWLVFQWEALRAASFYPRQPQSEGVMSILNPFKTVFPRRRAKFLKSIVRGALEAIAYCHVRGVVHGAVSLSCIILSTFDEREEESLTVKLASFGLGEDVSLGIEGLDESTIATCRQFGATSSLDVLSMLRQLDLYHLGLALLELIFSSLAKGGPSDLTSIEAVRRLWEGVFDLDVKAIRGFCMEDREWDIVVEFLDENDGEGWDLFGRLLKCQGFEADELLSSSWLKNKQE